MTLRCRRIIWTQRRLRERVGTRNFALRAREGTRENTAIHKLLSDRATMQRRRSLQTNVRADGSRRRSHWPSLFLQKQFPQTPPPPRYPQLSLLLPKRNQNFKSMAPPTLPLKEGIGDWKEAQRQGEYRVTLRITLLLSWNTYLLSPQNYAL